MYKRHFVGNIGEDIACKYLTKNDYEIIQRNFSCKQGEIDIIAQKGKEIVFIEVKTRTNRKYGNPIEAVTTWKKKHLIKAIEYYLYVNKLENSFISIDVIEIHKKKNKFCINHIKSAIEK